MNKEANEGKKKHKVKPCPVKQNWAGLTDVSFRI